MSTSDHVLMFYNINLIIEVDGGIHKTKEQQEYEIGRTAELNYWEIEVIRFTNERLKKIFTQS